MTDQVYMEVIVGEDEAPAIQEAHLEDSPANKTFVPVAWAAAYGLLFLHLNVKPLMFAFYAVVPNPLVYNNARKFVHSGLKMELCPQCLKHALMMRSSG